MTIEIEPIAGACGAEIRGVDLSMDLDNATFAAVHDAFLAHQALFFRDQHLTPDQQKALGRRFGTLNIHPGYFPIDGHPEIIPILKKADATENVGGTWHSDLSHLAEPPLASILHGIGLPPRGGDTLFANQYLAYESLSPGLKTMLKGLRAVHDNGIQSGAGRRDLRNSRRSAKLREGMERIENIHPVVRTHPETGRNALFVCRPFTKRFDQMTEAESRPLLDFLFAHAARPEFTCRFSWSPGAVAIWDNRCVLHHAINDYAGYRRYMHRVTVNGDAPFLAA